MPKYRLYRALLQLYPRRFRDHYGQEMVQVLDDLLAEEASVTARTAVWLRVYSELPYSIIYENISNLGDDRMSKLNKLNKLNGRFSKRTVGLTVGVVLIVALVFAHGWIRNTALPKIAGQFYKHGVTSQLANQDLALGSPFETLLGGTPKTEYNCSTYATQSFHTQVGCEALRSKYVVLSNVGSRQEVVDAAIKIEAKLKVQGFQGGNNGVTLTSLVSGTYEGKDYSPDAFYQKVSGQYACVMDTNIAYGNPAPAAINMRLWCDRTFNIFGQPNNITFDSTKGFGG
jgi:hypothetical protein